MSNLVTVFHPLGWPVEVTAERAEVLRGRGFTDKAPEVDVDDAEEAPEVDVDDAEEAPEDLKGESLDAALKEAGLPTTGKADEKRARLAEHLAAGQDSAD